MKASLSWMLPYLQQPLNKKEIFGRHHVLCLVLDNRATLCWNKLHKNVLVRRKCKEQKTYLASAPGRTFQLFTNAHWRSTFAHNDVYQLEFTVSSNKAFEYVVKESTVHRDWRKVYDKAFPLTYNFGSSKKVFTRNSFHHFWDDSFNGFAEMLERQTIKTAVIHADSEFNICLTAYKSLCYLEANPPPQANPPLPPRLGDEKFDRDLLDIRFRTRT